MASGGLKVSLSDVQRLKKFAESKGNLAAKAKEKASAVVDGVVRTAVSTGSAFALGAIDGYTDGVEVMGVGLPLIVAGAGHAGGMLMGGRTAPHLHAAADGALAYYAGTLGRKVGSDMRAKVEGAGGALPPGKVKTGALPPGEDRANAGEGLTPDEIEAVQRGRA